MLRRITAIGAPMAASGILFSLVYLHLGRILTGLGDANLAALGLGHRLEVKEFEHLTRTLVNTTHHIAHHTAHHMPYRPPPASHHTPH